MVKSKIFHKFSGESNFNEETKYDTGFSSIYTNMIKTSRTDDDVLKILELFIKKNTCKKFALKLATIEKFTLVVFSSKIKGNLFKDRSIYYYINEILHLLLKYLDRDYRIELLIYDLVQKYGKFLTVLKICKFGYTPFNALIWSSRKLPFSIFDNLTKMLHNLGYDVFMENKMGESSLEALLTKFSEDNKFSVEVFTQRYFALTNISERQILNTLTQSINKLCQESNQETNKDKYLNRVIFCFSKNFYLCYNALIFRIEDLKSKKDFKTLDKTLTILSQVSNKEINPCCQTNDKSMYELYLFFVSENIKNKFDFTEFVDKQRAISQINTGVNIL